MPTTTVDDTGRRVLGVLDEFIASMAKARDDLRAVLEAIDPPAGVGEDGSAAVLPPLVAEQLVTADSMNPGGAVRLITGRHPHVWHEVADVQGTTRPETRIIHFADSEPSVLVDSATTYPYLTPAEWADVEQGAAA